MNLSNLPPGVSNSDADPPQTPFEKYLEGMSKDDFAAFGGDYLWDNTPMLEALNRLWDAAVSYGFGRRDVAATPYSLGE